MLTGSLQIKNNTYYAVLNLKEGEKYKQKWITTKLNVKGNKRKAKEFLNELIVKYGAKEAKSDDILFSEYLMQWLEKRKIKLKLQRGKVIITQ